MDNQNKPLTYDDLFYWMNEILLPGISKIFDEIIEKPLLPNTKDDKKNN